MKMRFGQTVQMFDPEVLHVVLPVFSYDTPE